MVDSQLGNFRLGYHPRLLRTAGENAVLIARRYEGMPLYRKLVFPQDGTVPALSRHPGRHTLSCLPSRAKQASTHMISPEPTGGAADVA